MIKNESHDIIFHDNQAYFVSWTYDDPDKCLVMDETGGITYEYLPPAFNGESNFALHMLVDNFLDKKNIIVEQPDDQQFIDWKNIRYFVSSCIKIGKLNSK